MSADRLLIRCEPPTNPDAPPSTMSLRIWSTREERWIRRSVTKRAALLLVARQAAGAAAKEATARALEEIVELERTYATEP